MGERAKRHLRPAGTGDVDLRQSRRVFLIFGLNLEYDLVLTGRGIDRRDLARTESVVQRLVDQRWRDAHSRRRVAVDLDRDMGGGDLLIRGDVFELVHLSHLTLDDRRPMVELFDIGVGQRVLIEGTAQTSADADVLPGLHEEFDAFDRGHLGAQTSDDLAGGFRALIVWHQLYEHAR